MTTSIISIMSVLIAASLLGCSITPPGQNSIWQRIHEDVSANRVVSVTVKAVDYTVLTTRAASPETFAQMRGKSITLQLDQKLRRELSEAIEKTKLIGSNEAFRPDIRLGLAFNDTAGRVIHSIYFDGRYWNAINRKALIDGSPWKLRGGLIRFAEQAILEN